MMRLQRSLAGHWQFQLDPEGTLHFDQLHPDREITVPLPWQAAFPELQRYSGYVWYQTSFDLDEQWLDGDLLLHFGAVDYWCAVYINGQLAGEHEGGFTPFNLSIRRYVQSGSNTLSVRVYDAAQDSIVIRRWRDQPTKPQTMVAPEDMPHGKQGWYLNVSGIWQDVTLTAVPATYIDRVQVVTDIHTNRAYFEINLAGALEACAVAVTIGENRAQIVVEHGQPQGKIAVTVPGARNWTPEEPTLYTATIQLEGSDEINLRFGFREISTRDGKLLLNGEPIFLLSALDQDFYPETIYTVPSEDYLRDEFQKAKALGLNSLRCHIKSPDPLYLDLADEIGLLIWAEIPSWRTFQPKTQIHPPTLDDALTARVRQTFEEMARRDFNHPSLIIWTIVNEDWGTILPLSGDDRRWLAEMVDFCKQLDPTRLIVDNSPCPASWGLSSHVKTDLNDFHSYYNIPDHAAEFVELIEQFSLRPAWTFSLQDKSQATQHEPLILSEFGNWGLPTLKEMMANGQEPAWFDLGPWWSEWGGDPGFAHNVRQRFVQFGLDQIWPDYDSFAQATQWHQFAALKFEIETIRRSATLAGYVITELSDIYWESNGLLDFYRRPKVYFDQFSQFNTPDVIVAQLQRYAYWDDETVPAQLYVSHYSAADWCDARLRVNFGSSESVQDIPALERGSLQAMQDFTGQPTQTEQSAPQVLSAEVLGSTGSKLAAGETPLLILPARFRRAGYTQPIFVPDFAIRNALTTVGYQMGDSTDARLCVASKVDAALMDWVAQGGNLLHLSSTGKNPFIWQQGRGGAYSGDWMTSFSWLQPDVYKRLAVTNPVTMPFKGIMPASVLLDLPVADSAYHRDFLAGQITGWVGHPAVHTAQFRYGRGRVIITTYQLQEGLTHHPMAVAMLHDLVDHLVSDACQPTLVLKS